MSEDPPAPQRGKRRRERKPPAGPVPAKLVPAGPAPTEARLRDAALAHLARFAATEAGLLRVLQRRVDRWAQRAAAEQATADDPAMAEPAAAAIAQAAAAARQAAASVARTLVASGVVDDAAYAAARARRLSRAGRSRRAIAANLAAKGVPREAAAAALPTDISAELDAALGYCRRRRIGPFAVPGRAATPRVAKGAAKPQWGAPPSPEAAAHRNSLAAMARAGFDRATAEAALNFDPAAAAQRLAESRRG